MDVGVLTQTRGEARSPAVKRLGTTAANIGHLDEAQKVLVDEATSTLFAVAKDVSIQVKSIWTSCS